jgi:hypothetical protein
LAAEGPNDYMQRLIIKDKDKLHPVYAKIIQIHVTEEARHISFANQYLLNKCKDLPWFKKKLLKIISPFIINTANNLIFKLDKTILKKYKIPAGTMDEAYKNNTRFYESQQEVYSILNKAGLIDQASIKYWKLLGLLKTN